MQVYYTSQKAYIIWRHAQEINGRILNYVGVAQIKIKFLQGRHFNFFQQEEENLCLGGKFFHEGNLRGMLIFLYIHMQFVQFYDIKILGIMLWISIFKNLINIILLTKLKLPSNHLYDNMTFNAENNNINAFPLVSDRSLPERI